MLSALIVDDEEYGRKALGTLLAEYCPEVSVVASVGSADEAQAAVTRYAPDVVFLDIEMPDKDGFQFLESVHPDLRTFAVVFVTAYDHYAIKAIKAKAVDYLVKPIDIDELKQAVDNLLREVEQKEKQGGGSQLYFKQIEDILHSFKPKQDMPTRLHLPVKDGIDFVDLRDIVCCEASSNYSIFYLADGEKLMVSKPTKEYEHILMAADFMRVHHSYIVNLHYVIRYLREEGRESGGYLVLKTGDKIKVSRRKKDEVLDILAKYHMKQHN